MRRENESEETGRFVHSFPPPLGSRVSSLVGQLRHPLFSVESPRLVCILPSLFISRICRLLRWHNKKCSPRMSENVAAWWCVFLMSGVVSRSSRWRAPRQCGVLVCGVFFCLEPNCSQEMEEMQGCSQMRNLRQGFARSVELGRARAWSLGDAQLWSR